MTAGSFNVEVDLLDVQVNPISPVAVEVDCNGAALELSDSLSAQVVQDESFSAEFVGLGQKGDPGDTFLPVISGAVLSFESQQTGEEVASIDLVQVAGQAQNAVYIDGTAGQPIAFAQVVALGPDGSFVIASSNDLEHASLVLGVATNSALIGGPVKVLRSGTIENFGWSFNIGLPLFLGIDGAVTQQSDHGVFMLQVGVALSPTSALIEIHEPIVFG